MPALDAVLVTNVSATLTPGTAVAGDSLTVRSFPPPAKAHLLNVFGLPAKTNTTLTVEIKSPRLHDAVHGIHMVGPNFSVATVSPFDPTIYGIKSGAPDQLESQDTLEVDIQGGGNDGTEVDAVVMQIYYENLPGVNWRSITTAQLKARGILKVGVPVSITPTVATRAWQGGVAITSTYDVLKANRDYALLGFQVQSAAGAQDSTFVASLRSADTGNLRVVCPVFTGYPALGQNYFPDLSRMYETADFGFIPVFNASNKGSMIVDIAAAGGTLATVVNAIFMLLD